MFKRIRRRATPAFALSISTDPHNIPAARRPYLDAPSHVSPEPLGGLHSLLRVDFFLILLFAITMYLRQVMNKNTRANTRRR
jgi:hypothetical protein